MYVYCKFIYTYTVLYTSFCISILNIYIYIHTYSIRMFFFAVKIALLSILFRVIVGLRFQSWAFWGPGFRYSSCSEAQTLSRRDFSVIHGSGTSWVNVLDFTAWKSLDEWMTGCMNGWNGWRTVFLVTLPEEILKDLVAFDFCFWLNGCWHVFRACFY